VIRAPERSADRDAAIAAMLSDVPFDGWSRRSLVRGLAELGAPADEADLLFPGGAVEMVEAFCDLADRRMSEAAASLDPAGQHLPARVRAVIALRLVQNRPHKEAVRRALGVLAMPGHARQAAACTARTVDAILHAARDRSVDFSWYTKRAMLTVAYGGALLYWLRDSSEDDAATLAFLDRRLSGIARIRRLRTRADAMVQRLAPLRRRNA